MKKIKNSDVESIINKLPLHFRTFGGGYVNKDNPISMALANQPVQFAAGVDATQVVKFVLKELDIEIK